MKLFKNTKKKPGSKVVVGGKKTSNKKTKKSFLKIGYFSVLALLLFSAVGDVGYNYLQANQLKAHAENWTTIGPPPAGVKVSACKQSTNSIYGPLWKIRMLVTIKANTYQNSSVTLKVYRGNSVANTGVSQGWWLGAVTEVDVFTSQLYPNDSITGSLGGGPLYIGALTASNIIVC